MDYKEWYLTPWRKWKDFQGRARRTEYFTFALANAVISMILGFLVGFFTNAEGQITGLGHIFNIILFVFGLAIIVPGLAVSFRRIHDIGRSAWWLLLYLVPLIGVIVLLIMFLQNSKPGANQYGPNPKGE